MKSTEFDASPALLESALPNTTCRPISSLRLNFRNAPLKTVLNYLCDAADLSIEVEPNVEIERTINLWNDEPLTKQDSLLLLKQALNEKGFVAIQKGPMLAIIRNVDAKKHRIPLPTCGYSAAE